jgi:hypothetical protein
MENKIIEEALKSASSHLEYLEMLFIELETRNSKAEKILIQLERDLHRHFNKLKEAQDLRSLIIG